MSSDAPAAAALRIMCEPGTGSPKRYAVKVNGPWRVTFGWDGKDALDVDLEQYH